MPCTRPSARETSHREKNVEHQRAESGRHPDSQKGIDQRAYTETQFLQLRTVQSQATDTMQWPLDRLASRLSMLKLL